MNPAELRKLLDAEPENTLYGVIPLHARSLLRVAEVFEEIIKRVDANDEPYTQSPEDAALEREAREALAALREVKP